MTIVTNNSFRRSLQREKKNTTEVKNTKRQVNALALKQTLSQVMGFFFLCKPSSGNFNHFVLQDFLRYQFLIDDRQSDLPCPLNAPH